MQQPRTRTGWLEGESLNTVRALEDELGSCIVVWKAGRRPANLSPEQLRRLQERERELGVILLAYDCASPM